MDFRILGPLEIRGEAGPIAIRGRHHPKLLALLLDQANRVVPVDRLVHSLWEETAPDTAARQTQNIAAALRRQLGDAGKRLERVGHGYQFKVEEHELDLLRCKRNEARAREFAITGRPDRAAEALREALAEWRGPSLAGQSGRMVEATARRLNEFRLNLLNQRINLDLGLGRHEELMPELQALVTEHPLLQPFSAHLMTALHRCGRTPEALLVFTDLSKRLAEELGVDPGSELRHLHTAILRDDPELLAIKFPPARTPDAIASSASQASPAAAPTPALSSAPPAPPAPSTPGLSSAFSPTPMATPATTTASTPAPSMLPADTPAFTGRNAVLRSLDDLLDTTRTAGLAVITGVGGIGKSTLAAHWAHRVAERFPDGQLHVNLRGFDIEDEPMSPTAAARLMLTALGVPPSQIPSDEDAQTALYRGLVADRSILIVLDNARDAAQVRPILPGGPGTFTLITSRNQLSGLVAQGARPVPLDVLDTEDSRQLLASHLGPARVATEPQAVQRIVSACRGLPLALAIVAARAATRPGFTLEALGEELRGDLDGFAGDDPATDIRTVFSWSYRALSGDAARLFRLLSLHSGPDWTAPAAASLAAVPARSTRRLLRELAAAHLISEHVPGRFGFHDLVRAYAGELHHEIDTAAEREAALRRVFDHYLHTTHNAAMLFDTQSDPIRLGPVTAGAAPETLDDPQHALVWSATELQVLLATVRAADRARLGVHTWKLALAMTNILQRNGSLQEGLIALRIGVQAAERVGAVAGQIQLLRHTSLQAFQLGREDQAFAHLRLAMALCAEVDDAALLARVHRNCAVLRGRQERYEEAVEHGFEALRMFLRLGDERGTAMAFNNIGWYFANLGRFDEALEYCEQALESSRRIGDFTHVASVLDSIGYIHLRRGNHKVARDYFQDAIEKFELFSSRSTLVLSMEHLGDANLDLGEANAARAAWQRALAIPEGLMPAQMRRIEEKLGRLEM